MKFSAIPRHILFLISLSTYIFLSCASLTMAAQETASTESIGGRFMLEDHTGTVVTDQHFRGQFMLITFGYTFCPDVCPTNLVNMSMALEYLGAQADQLAPIFVTVDPHRDTSAVLRDYVGNFDNRIIGLTGTQPLIDSILQRYKIVAEVHRPQDWTGGDYIVDHTASIFLMSPDGEFLVKFAHGMNPEKMAERISDFLK